MSYQTILRGGSKKDKCPKCGEKTFTPYLQIGTGKPIAADCGRCDRENSCGYHKPPREVNDLFTEYIRPDTYIPNVVKSDVYDLMPTEFVDKTINIDFQECALFRFLCSKFKKEIVIDVFNKYKCGRVGEDVVYWQHDKSGNVRTGKQMRYLTSGKRDKTKPPYFLHKQIKDDYKLKQCFFGVHLVGEGKKCYIAESEKTALILSIYYHDIPNIVFVATGGSHNLHKDKLSDLIGCQLFAIPDSGCYELWKHKLKDVTCKFISCEHLPKGDDIADALLSKPEDLLNLRNAIKIAEEPTVKEILTVQIEEPISAVRKNRITGYEGEALSIANEILAMFQSVWSDTEQVVEINNLERQVLDVKSDTRRFVKIEFDIMGLSTNGSHIGMTIPYEDACTIVGKQALDMLITNHVVTTYEAPKFLVGEHVYNTNCQKWQTDDMTYVIYGNAIGSDKYFVTWKEAAAQIGWQELMRNVRNGSFDFVKMNNSDLKWYHDNV